MAQRGNVIFPVIGGREVSPSPRSYEVVKQKYDAINVEDPRKVTFYEDNVVSPVRTNVHSPRINALEDKLSMAVMQTNQVMQQQQQVNDALTQQQQLTKNLIDKAFQNRDDFIDNLGRLTDNRIEENTRFLLQNHLKYITAIVQRLNYDIADLEAQIRTRDYAVIGTNNAVGKLEVHHVTMLQDLRNRIARCDASLMKHSSDIRNCYTELQAINRDQSNVKSGIADKVHQLEAEMISMGAELARLTEQQAVEITHMKKDSNRELSLLEEKNSSAVMEVKRAMHDLEMSTSNHRSISETKLMAMLTKATESWNDVLTRLEYTVNQNGDAFENRLKRLESAISADRGAIKELQKAIENNVVSRLNAYSHYLEKELTRAKREFREGFTSVHDSIANSKAVVEGKNKLLEDRLLKEIGKIKKVVMFHHE